MMILRFQVSVLCIRQPVPVQGEDCWAILTMTSLPWGPPSSPQAAPTALCPWGAAVLRDLSLVGRVSGCLQAFFSPHVPRSHSFLPLLILEPPTGLTFLFCKMDLTIPALPLRLTQEGRRQTLEVDML